MKLWELVKEIQEGRIPMQDVVEIIDDKDKKYRSRISKEHFNYLTKILNLQDIEFVNKKIKPLDGQKYYSITNDGLIISKEWTNSTGDNFAYRHNNCFPNEKEAKRFLKYKEALSEMEKPFVRGERNLYMCCDEDTNNIYLVFSNWERLAGIKYFGTDEEAVKNFIERWEKDILKYEFEVEEEVYDLWS